MAKAMQFNSNLLTAPRWAGDFMSPERLLPGGAKLDASALHADDAVSAVVGVAGAAQGAVSVPVAALSGPIPSGVQLDFGGAKLAITTALAAAGAVAIAVRALPTALVSTDTAIYPGTELESIPSGTLVGRTFAEEAAGTPFGPAANGDDQVYLVAFDVTDVNENNDVELYRHQGLVKTNFLPAFTTLGATLIAKIRAAYECTEGVD